MAPDQTARYTPHAQPRWLTHLPFTVALFLRAQQHTRTRTQLVATRVHALTLHTRTRTTF
jgi:hypothetical protein